MADDTDAEVERAMENLIKSGKMFPIPGRRDSMPTMGSRPFPDFGEHESSRTTVSGADPILETPVWRLRRCSVTIL